MTRRAAILIAAWMPAADLAAPSEARTGEAVPVAARVAESPRAWEIPIAERLGAHLQYLGSDSLAGRAPGTPGGAAAAAYIAARLTEFGLEPAGPHASWHQPVPFHGGRPLSGAHLRIETTAPEGGSVDPPETTLVLGRDYLLGATGAGTSIARPASVVFAGYGIVAPEYDYDDYRAVDVRGAVAAYLEGEPESGDASYFDGPQRTVHAYAETKRRQALARGARGSILLLPPAAMATWNDLQREYAFEHRTLAYDVTRNLTLVMNPAAAPLLFHDAEQTFEEVCALAAEGKVRSFPLPSRLSFRGRFRERDFTAPNVAGMLRGNDPLLREEWVLLSAHYDGLGVGPAVRGDSVYNGVIDNASGTAALLEIAHDLSVRRARLRRSLLFLFTTGEESGLLGARYYCDHPLVPLHRTVANLNLDGLAFLDRFDDVVPVGAEELDLRGLLDRTAAAMNLGVGRVPALFSLRDQLLRGDHYAFAVNGIPSFLVQEGISYRGLDSGEAIQSLLAWGREVYHSPFDDLRQPIRLEASCLHLELLAALAESLACTLDPPRWMPGAAFEGARLRARAEGR